MRKLQTKDIFAAIKMIKSLNMKEDLKNTFKTGVSINNQDDTENNSDDNSDKLINSDKIDYGVELIWLVIDKITILDDSNALYDFLSGPFECTSDDIKCMDLDDLIDNLEILATENNLNDFFKKVKNLIVKMKK